MPSGRLPKGKTPLKKRVRVTFRFPKEIADGIKRAAKRKGVGQTDYMENLVRSALIADGIIKPKKEDAS